MSHLMIGEQVRRNRSLESLRSDVLYEIKERTEGIYYRKGSSILANEDADRDLVAVLCPREEYNAVKDSMMSFEILLLECNKWWSIIEDGRPNIFWKVVTSSTCYIRNVKLSPEMVRSVSYSLLKARQRYLLRQTEGTPVNPRGNLMSALQRFLERLQSQEPCTTSDPRNLSWKLTEMEERVARESLVQKGPKKQVSKAKCILSSKGPQLLVPLSHFASSSYQVDWRGFIDKIVSTVTPANAVRVLLPMRREAQESGDGYMSVGRVHKRHSDNILPDQDSDRQGEHHNKEEKGEPVTPQSKKIKTAHSDRSHRVMVKEPAVTPTKRRYSQPDVRAGSRSRDGTQASSSRPRSRFMSEDPAEEIHEEALSSPSERDVSTSASLPPSTPIKRWKSKIFQSPLRRYKRNG